MTSPRGTIDDLCINTILTLSIDAVEHRGGRSLDRMGEEHDRQAARRFLRGLCVSLRATPPREAGARAVISAPAHRLRAQIEPHLDAEERIPP